MMLLRNQRPAPRPQRAAWRVWLLIAESGTERLSLPLSYTDCEELVVLRQSVGDSPVDLIVRATALISDLERAGKHVGRATIAIAPLLDPQLTAARRMLGLSILSHVHACGQSSELVLAVDDHAGPDLRREVTALAESLVAHPGSRHAPIRVRFASAAGEPLPHSDRGLNAASTIIPG